MTDRVPGYPGLDLCKCGHTKSGHQLRPLWYGAHECEVRCAGCECHVYERGEYQGLSMTQDKGGK